MKTQTQKGKTQHGTNIINSPISLRPVEKVGSTFIFQSLHSWNEE